MHCVDAKDIGSTQAQLKVQLIWKTIQKPNTRLQFFGTCMYLNYGQAHVQYRSNLLRY